MNEAFQFCPKCGQKSLSSPETKLIECTRCDFHFYRNPAIATAAIITDGSGRIMLIRRAKDPAKGKLGMPGGFVDIGETAEDGLRREVKEEICLEIAGIEFLMSHPNEYFYRGIMYPTVDLFFTAQVDSFEPARALSEVAGLVIRPPKEVAPEELAFESMRRALRAYNLAG
jgi:ADP-ribose pyrophosphatase YjhB (NUDIX family)